MQKRFRQPFCSLRGRVIGKLKRVAILFYTHLLKSGVKLYERRHTILHAKTAVVDGVWSTIGSTNLDLWSFLRNDEVNTIILGQDFAFELEAMFAKDLEDSKEVHLEEWEKRSFSEQMKEWFTRLFRYWL
jgi:cardiolipin synthase